MALRKAHERQKKSTRLSAVLLNASKWLPGTDLSTSERQAPRHGSGQAHLPFRDFESFLSFVKSPETKASFLPRVQRFIGASRLLASEKVGNDSE